MLQGAIDENRAHCVLNLRKIEKTAQYFGHQFQYLWNLLFPTMYGIKYSLAVFLTFGAFEKGYHQMMVSELNKSHCDPEFGLYQVCKSYSMPKTYFRNTYPRIYIKYRNKLPAYATLLSLTLFR